MADKQTKNTPDDEDHSIEEILSSIRRIISEDDIEEAKAQKAAPAPAAAAPAPTPAPQPKAPEAKAPPPPAPKVPEAKAAPLPVEEEELQEIEILEDDSDDDVLELTEVVPEEDFYVPEEIVEVEEVLPPKKEAPSVDIFMQDSPFDSELLSDQVAESALDSMAKLASKVKETKAMADQPLSQIDVSRITLEEIVRQEVKPIIRTWLDVNLPSLVERIVEREISKLRSRIED